ncbi:MAG: FmdB family zinc ribbon protein [Chloroflexota bacterium]
MLSLGGFQVPIYEYSCSECGESFEKLVRTSSGSAEIRCPKCNTDRVARKVSVFGFSGGSSGGSFGGSYSGGSSCGPVGG